MSALKKFSAGGFVRKNPVLITCVSIILILSVYYGFRYSANPEAEERLSLVNEEADRLALNLKNSAQLAEQMASLEESMGLINAKLMQSTALALNQQYFYKLVSDTGTKLLELRQGTVLPNAKKENGFVPIPFVVSVQGEYPKVMAFLQNLESGSYILRIVTVNIAPVPGTSLYEDSGTEMINMSISLEVLGVP